MEDLRNKIEYLAHKKPDKLAEMVKEMYHKAPQDVEYMLEQFSGGEHLTNKDDYEKWVKKLKWIDNRGAGAKWQFDDIIRLASIIEKEGAVDLEQVNVVPVPKAGGSFATAAYKYMENPVAVENIKADAGLDIGGVLIGMHLKNVAVPVKLSEKNIGNALLLAARTRPKFIGGVRANYDEEMI